MEYLNKNMQAMANNFNWDDIEVGNHALNHSQKFFAKKHIKHERLDESEEEMDVLKEIDAITLDDTFTSNLDKENVNNTNTSTFDTKSPLKETKHAILNEGDGTDVKFLKTCPQLNTPGKICREQEEIKSTSQSESPINSLKEIKSQPANTLVLSESLIARNKARINPSANKKAPSESNIKDSEPTLTTKTVKLSESLIVRNKARINPGVKTEKVANPTTAANGSTVSTGTIAKPVTAPAPTAPHAYQCNELYKRRKEEQLQKCIEEERKRREFHSRPVPNFNAVHKSLQQRKVLHVVTVPVTPMVLKKSNETEAKRKKKKIKSKYSHQNSNRGIQLFCMKSPLYQRRRKPYWCHAHLIFILNVVYRSVNNMMQQFSGLWSRNKNRRRRSVNGVKNNALRSCASSLRLKHDQILLNRLF
nr:uncharacterized protein LOC106617158 isoform X3 [Bactrocera oleae]